MTASIAFATEELYPFGPGGIGRLVHHLVFQALRERTSNVHLFVGSSLGLSQERVQAVFGPRVTASTFEGAALDPLARSLALAEQVTSHCDRHEPFEWIELPDFRGLGFATLHQAATRGLRGSPRLAVRIHGPNSVVSWHEDQPIDATRAAEFDLERSSLLLADQVIAPLGAVRDAVADFFRFDDAWRERVRLSLPPRTAGQAAPSPAQAVSRIIFPTKAQGIKRPDLFVSGVTELLRRRPRWAGQVALAAHRNPEIEASLFHAMSREVRARFEWVSWNDAERARHFAGQVVVIPSDFETLSLAAWEAAEVGARVVASTRCPAFAEGSRWTAWPGFHGFDGTVSGLAGALERALDSAAPPPLSVPPSPLWKAEPAPSSARAVSVSPEEIAIVGGGLEDWTRQLGEITTPWVLLLRAADEVEAEAFRRAAATALSRRSAAAVVSAAAVGLGSPTQAWASTRPPSGAIVASTELARQVISPTSGRRALLAVASQLGLECLYLFVPSRAPASDEERFPPLTLDAHPLAVRAQRDGEPPLRKRVLKSARDNLKRLLRRR